MSRREDHIRRKNLLVMVVLGIALLAIFLTSTDFGGEILDRLLGKQQVQSEVRPLAAPVEGALMEVHFIDVGQGDAQLVRVPKAEGGFFTLLIDSGEYRAYPDLKARLEALGVDKIDALVVSHPHSDHMGGMAAVIRDFEIGGFYMPPVPAEQIPTTVSYEKMLDALEKKGLGITVLTAGSVLPGTPSASVNVLGPVAGKTYDDLNNYSLVLGLRYGETRFLFTGDAELQAWEDILESGYSPGAQVLKVGHHGSREGMDSRVMDQILPEAAVVSCGKDNDYGHPHQEALELLDNFGCAVYRTDKQGTIVAKADGKAPVQFEDEGA